ncbi:DUF1800 family protein [Dyadobacter sp. SG02]|uniref:DUF1800 domain-containing protein n=1 Tax=Dyadobacter sp. SG02 TaxID=1855291 RepID=UPI001E569E22|nr:DUF1800 family protein [Dyadobacter sp. SG02]
MAAHLLRRATFGPTKQEIVAFTGLTASQAVEQLIANSTYHSSPPPPVDLDETKPTAGQPFLTFPFNKERRSEWCYYIRYWWAALMADQSKPPSVLEKLTTFWQNHFVVPQGVVFDYRMTDSYMRLLRRNALGNFKTMTFEMTNEAAMLLFQNGNENAKTKPNENYGRELQELFVVGQKDFSGNPNYLEDDVKAAAKVLTGWQVKNYLVEGSTSFEVVFTPDRHDTGVKTFSALYGNRTIQGRTDKSGAEQEIHELIDMLTAHPESPKHICRKLYRWYVNANIDLEIENNVIIPLANLFSSAENGFRIEPVIRKLLSSEIFYDQRNRGAIFKSPMELVIGTLRLFEIKVPNMTADLRAFRIYGKFAYDNMATLQQRILDQPSVFGYVPYYQTGYSKNWINGTAIGLRNQVTDRYIIPYTDQEIRPGYVLWIDLVAWATALQPNFSDVQGTPAITSEFIVDKMIQNFFVFELTQSQKNFLIDSIMMTGVTRNTWINEWNAYRTTPTDVNKKNAVQRRCRLLLRHMFSMAEYHVF